MLEVFVLLVFCSFLAHLYDKSCSTELLVNNNGRYTECRRYNHASQIVFIMILIIMVCFSGLRTKMNDTEVYLINYQRVPNTLSSIMDIDWTIGENPLFSIYQIIIRSLISRSGYVFLFISACIVVTSYLLFIKRYSVNFSYSLFLLISFTTYAFTMAAMKQTMATAIAVWAVPNFLNGKRVKAAFLILIAMLIHPYVIIFFAIYFVSDNIWDKKMKSIVVASLIGKILFTTLLSIFMRMASTIGDDYTMEYFVGGVNLFRVFVYMVVPGLSFIYRNNIRNTGNKFSFLCINLATISSCFMILASSGGANMIGRLASYFDLFHCMALPMILHYGVRGKISNVLKFFSILGFSFFYFTYYSKYTMALDSCVYNHISLLELISGWW